MNAENSLLGIPGLDSLLPRITLPNLLGNLTIILKMMSVLHILTGWPIYCIQVEQLESPKAAC